MKDRRSTVLAGALLCLTGGASCPGIAGDAGPAPPLRRALRGPLDGAKGIVFAVRSPGKDPHWYANFGYYARDVHRKPYGEGGGLYLWDPHRGERTVILEDPRGTLRDPQVHYDGRTIVFSYRPGGEEYFHLYEINADGTGLRQITHGPCDDIEPTYLPDDEILFCSTRCNRWVGCWLTKVAILYRCDRQGGKLRPVSGNTVHDNTPWPLPDGRILYTRWEYVDRSQVKFHHLWVMNPDGTGQTVYYGNLHPDTVMIDAKPIPGTNRAVAIFSPGHGRTDHAGAVTIVDPGAGPDERAGARRIGRRDWYIDPYPLSDDLFLVAGGPRLFLLDGRGTEQAIYSLPPGEAGRLTCHEPRPLQPRPREPLIPSRVRPEASNGRIIAVDVHRGRRMDGVKKGEIKKLLVLEILPTPVNYSGGMEPITMGGSFNLEGILGFIPVEADGSVYAELPPLRSLFFVAMDGEDRAVKRMHSFLSLQPGETLSCIGCHEQRIEAPPPGRLPALKALQRPPSQVEPIPGIPEVFDFPRDIQPILDRHCLKCHDYDKRSGGVILSGDRGPIYSHSYVTLIGRRLITDGRNELGNRAPRSIGAAASRIREKIDGSHHGVKPSGEERRLIRFWIEAGATYPGTYAALGSGMIGGYEENQPVFLGMDDPRVMEAVQTVQSRCSPCHQGPRLFAPSPWHEGGRAPRHSRHTIYNLSRPERSLVLLAPLGKPAGGYGICRVARGDAGPEDHPVLASVEDPDYRRLLAGIQAAKEQLEKGGRFDMPGFRPTAAYIREMQRYGVLAKDLGPADPVDPYTTDHAYWRSFWHRPSAPSGDDQSR